jgi:16S rRNA (cytidine1402-2'-O)-methyltransferase
MLYLIATPIGNLSDITFRAIETLKLCDYILCEDTRHSLTLLNHYEIKKPLKSYHKFNESSESDSIIEDLLSGKNIALISDAGTPGISDPGEFLVKRCINQEIPVTAIPGPCAAIQALSCSGLGTENFQFIGFLERKERALQDELRSIMLYKGTTICYESPKRLISTLKTILEIDPHRKIVVARELTKKFEEIQRGTAQELLNYWESHPLKGEIVLMIAEAPDQALDWKSLSPEEHVNVLQNNYGLSKKEAIKMAAELRGVPKRDVYNSMI